MPYSRVNGDQRKAINKHYKEPARQFNLPEANIPDFTVSELNSGQRRKEILNELEQSGANLIILLGDLPIKWFLAYFAEENFKKLSDFGNTKETYYLYR